MNSTALPRYLLPAVALTALLSLVSIATRYKVEQRNRSVSISAEYEIVESLAASQGIDMPRALLSLKAQGLRSVVLSEETAGELIAAGRLAVRYPTDGKSTRVAPIVSGAPADMRRLVRGNRIRYGGFSAPVSQPGGSEQFPNLTPGMLRALPLGLDPEAAKLVSDAHLSLIARMGNPTGISKQGVTDTIGWAAELGAKVFCPQGDQVLGRRDAQTTLVEALTNDHMLYASPEFAKIGGDEQMLQLAPELVVRLHSAQAAELDKLPEEEAIDRYARAARERNMRILLLRPIDYAAAEPLFKFGEFTKKVADKVVKQGGALGEAHGFNAPKLPGFWFALIGLSLIPTAFFVGGRLRSDFAMPAAVVATLLGLACLKPHFVQFDALLGAMTFPIAAFLVLETLRTRSVLLAYSLTTAISLTGGLMVGGLLNSLPYYIRAMEFPGVKLSVFLPIIVVGWYYFKGLTDSKTAMSSAITWGAILLSLIFLAAAGFMLARTGNDNPAAVSSWELKMRDVLDKVLLVRPRTKAFAIGFPLLYLGVAMLQKWKTLSPERQKQFGGWTALALVGGAIGQTDIVNTMCHIHSPVALSLARIGIAVLVGTILGVVLLAIVKMTRFWPSDASTTENP